MENNNENIVKQLGLLVIEYSSLMLAIDLFSYELLGIQQNEWQIYASKISDRNKIACLGEILKLKKPSLKSEDIHVVIKRAHKAEKNRNRYLHSAYSPTTTVKLIRLKLPRELGKFGVFEVDASELEEFVVEIKSIRKDIAQLVRLN